MSGPAAPAPPAARRPLRHSAALRLALAFAGMSLLTIAIVLSVFYVRTVVLLEQRTMRQVAATSQQLQARYAQGGREALVQAIDERLGDGQDSDRELLLLLDADGRRLAGGTRFAEPAHSGDAVQEQTLLRAGMPAPGFVTTRVLEDGTRLVVGHDRSEQVEMAGIVGDAIRAATFLAVLLVVGGAYMFRDLLEQRIGALRDTAARVAAGSLAERVPPGAREDEFALLEHDINRMLDRIESLMRGVRHVSDTIAHNLRTPLTRALARLHEVQRAGSSEQALREAIDTTIAELQGLNVVFHKLLQIAEAEAGARRQQFTPQPLHAIASDVVELYAAVAEEQDCALELAAPAPTWVAGDRDLLASAIANLVDNALKFAHDTPAARVRVAVGADGAQTVVEVLDNGPGVPPASLARLGERFYRVQEDRPGTGLGLASVAAIAHLHGAELRLANAAPGLRAQLVFSTSA